MSSLVVGGVPIKVAVSSPRWTRMDAVDRARAFDNTFRASQTGGAVRTWDFETPAVLAATEGETYKAALSTVASQLCSGDILALPIMCSAELTDGVPTSVAGDPYVVLSFTLHEVQPAKVLLRYAPGDTISGESFTRASTALYQDSAGIYQSAAINVKRDAHYIGVTRHLLLEEGRINSALWSRDLTNAAWTKTGTTTQTLTAVGLDGTANSATIITDTDAGVSSSFNQAWAVANNGAKHSIAVWFRKDTDVTRFPGVGVGLSGGTPVSRQIHLNTLTGAITNSVAPAGTTSARVVDAGLWWIVEIVLTNNTSGNVTLTLNIFPAAGSVFGTNAVVTGGSVTVGQVNTELNVGFHSSPIFTTTVAVTRSSDFYSIPFTTPPQEMSVYTAFREVGRQIASEFLFQVGSAASANPRFLTYSPAGFYVAFHEEAVGGPVTSTLPNAPANGDAIEIVTRLSGDGSVNASQSLNGATETTSAQSGTSTLTAAWSGQLFWLNSAGTAGQIGYRAFSSVKLVAGTRSLTELRAL